MIQCYQDAMALVNRFGKPDLFVTITCNPHWVEIINSLLPHQTYSDRPDIVVRVFKLKFEEFLRDLTERHVLGQVVAYSLAIEFQKRGLPHAHVLLILREEDKFFDVRRIDNVISAEIPDRIQNPLLYDLVGRFMIHGPHSPTSSCMEQCSAGAVNLCSKKFPMRFQEETVLQNEGYPLYRRPRNGRTVSKPSAITPNQIEEMSNEWVVPHCPKLLLKYKCHINVEVCTNISAVKYIYKYTYKGHDVAQLNIVQVDPNNETLNYDEISYYSS